MIYHLLTVLKPITVMLKEQYCVILEAVAQRCSVKKVF